MKKSFLFFAALAISGGMSFAQAPINRIAEISQEGLMNKAGVNQSGPGYIRAEVKQEKGFNTAKIDQINLHNMPGALIESKVIQTGIGNDATVKQTHNGMGMFPLTAKIVQTGNKNTASQIQGPASFSPFLGPLSAKIIQTGNGNTANQEQYGVNNKAKIIQTGNHNTASQLQTNASNLAKIIQTGNDNTADQKQYGMNLKAKIIQKGDGNTANQEQYGMFNVAYASQPGNNNLSTQIQHQFSSNNYASVLQKGNWGTAWQEQSGNWNKAEIEQGDYSFGNKAIQIQKSDGQAAFGNYVNIAKITQDGFGSNYAEQYQTNMFNVIPNEATIAQTGFMNYASQTQFGGSNLSTITQTGTSNTAVVTQTPFIMP